MQRLHHLHRRGQRSPVQVYYMVKEGSGAVDDAGGVGGAGGGHFMRYNEETRWQRLRAGLLDTSTVLNGIGNEEELSAMTFSQATEAGHVSRGEGGAQEAAEEIVLLQEAAQGNAVQKATPPTTPSRHRNPCGQRR